MRIKPGLIVAFLAILNILAWIGVYELSEPKALEVVFFDVGQGDAIFLKTPQGRQILIDGGPDSAVLEKLGQEMPFWDRTLDLIVLTHPEHDHINGLIEVLKRYKVDNILWTGVLQDTAEYREWLKLLEGKEAKIYIAKSGLYVKPGLAEIEILYPFESLEGKEARDINNTSIVLRLVFRDNAFLFTGDILGSVEEDLLDRMGEKTDADVLKVAHHGSKTSCREEFLTAVSPETAIISVGKDNKYGHPSQEVLESLEKYGIKIFRTDLQGDIKIISNGKTYGVSNI